jgi:hypothetical protein
MFICQVDHYELLEGSDAMGRRYVKPLAFSPKTVPLFLEGPVRQLKTLKSTEDAKAVYEMVKASELHDTVHYLTSINTQKRKKKEERERET